MGYDAKDERMGGNPNQMNIQSMYADIDLSAAVENLLLEADELGLGAVWMGISPLPDRMKAVEQVLNAPENPPEFALIPCGNDSNLSICLNK